MNVRVRGVAVVVVAIANLGPVVKAQADAVLQVLAYRQGEAFELAGNCAAATLDPKDSFGQELARRGIVLSDEVWSAIAAGVQQASQDIAELSEDEICDLARERFGPDGTEATGLIEFE